MIDDHDVCIDVICPANNIVQQQDNALADERTRVGVDRPSTAHASTAAAVALGLGHASSSAAV
jgi:hypothetical protein